LLKFSGTNPSIDIDNAGSTITLYDLEIDVNNLNTLSIADAEDIIIVTRNLTLTNGKYGSTSNGVIEVQGNLSIGSEFDGGTGKITFTGTNAQTITHVSGGILPSGVMTLNKTAESVTLASDLTLAGALTVNDGTFDMGATFNLTTAGVLTVEAGGIFRNVGTGTLTLGGNVSNAGTITIDGNGVGCGGADVLITASSARTWSGTGTFNLTDVNLVNQTTSLSIIVYSGTEGSGTSGFIFLDCPAPGPTNIYRSVGPSATSALAVGTSNALTISVFTATFNSSPGTNIGVGDVIQYDSSGNGTVDSLAFIHGRTDEITYTVKNASGSAPNAVTGDNDWSIFRAYTSLANAENGIENTGIAESLRNFDDWTEGGDATISDVGKDLTQSDEIWNIALYANGTTPDSSNATIEGWITSATQYINIYTPYLESEVEVSQRHSGVWDDTKYVIQGTGTNATVVLNALVDHTRITGLQVQVLGTGVYGGILSNDSAGRGGLRIIGNIVMNTFATVPTGPLAIAMQSSTSSTAGDNVAANNIVYGKWDTAIYMRGERSANKGITYNNTVYGEGGSAYRSRGEHSYAINNIAFGTWTNHYLETTQYAVADYNGYNGGSDPGTNGINLAAYTGSQVFVDPTVFNFHLVAGSPAINVGLDLTENGLFGFDYDIDSDPRPTGVLTWDIGADEYVVVTGITISGTVFQADALTPVVGTPAIRMSISAATSLTLNLSSGTFAFSNVTQPSSGSVITIWMDTSNVTNATMIFRYGSSCAGGSASCTGLNLFQDAIVIGPNYHDSAAITNTNLASCDSET
jgi:hypothetical protein